MIENAADRPKAQSDKGYYRRAAEVAIPAIMVFVGAITVGVGMFIVKNDTGTLGAASWLSAHRSQVVAVVGLTLLGGGTLLFPDYRRQRAALRADKRARRLSRRAARKAAKRGH